MKFGITPRFEYSQNNSIKYSFENDLVEALLDSFSKSEVQFLYPRTSVNINDLDFIVLSGGSTPGEDAHRDLFEIGIIELCKSSMTPMLGICRGAQLLAINSGATLKPVNGHVNAKRKLIGHKSLGRCYHNFSIQNLSKDWKILSKDEIDNSPEVFVNIHNKSIGIMSHPEREICAVANMKSLFEIFDKWPL